MRWQKNYLLAKNENNIRVRTCMSVAKESSDDINYSIQSTDILKITFQKSVTFFLSFIPLKIVHVPGRPFGCQCLPPTDPFCDVSTKEGKHLIECFSYLCLWYKQSRYQHIFRIENQLEPFILLRTSEFRKKYLKELCLLKEKISMTSNSLNVML